MALRVITARLSGSHSDGAVLDGALALSKACGGHIDALFARPDPRLAVPVSDEGLYPDLYEEMVAGMERQWTEVANKALKNFDRWRTTNQVRTLSAPDADAPDVPSVEWRDAVGSESETIGRKGRIADVIVSALPRRHPSSPGDLSFEAALLETGRPVLLMPSTHRADPTEGKIVVAWNGSAEAFRAVKASMPLLVKAEEVLVFTSSESDVDPAMADELVAYLRWHGAKAATLKGETGTGNSVEDSLMRAVKKTKAGLLVMGAYTHSRVRELLFGGVTRHVFAHATTPVLMAH